MISTHQAISFHKHLEMQSGIKLNLKINDNRSTMLRVRWERGGAAVSLHRMFLQAPQNIMQDLACYLKREHKKLTPGVLAYIEESVQKLDYRHELDLSRLESRGKVYNLKKIYDRLNDEYFGGKLDLHVTWFGEKWRGRRSRITFGLYHDPLRLIKIHRLLDDKAVPDYVLSYIIYHEMVHHVSPPTVDKGGHKRIHNKRFCQIEKQFEFYNEAKQWISDHRDALFNGKIG